MFNTISQQKLCQIIATEFPEWSPFADILYEKKSWTQVCKEDGLWEVIEVQEGSAQGCPVSPVFAALVLNSILQQINTDLTVQANERKSPGQPLNDSKRGLPLIMAYVDDVTVLISICDVEVCLQLFKKYGAPLGAVLNTEKTRILTSTNNTSTVDKLLSSGYTHNNFIGTSLQNEIAHFSCDKDRSPLKIKNGLRVLGIPIGSHKFCTGFILTADGNNRLQEPPEWIRRLPNHVSAIQNMHHS